MTIKGLEMVPTSLQPSVPLLASMVALHSLGWGVAYLSKVTTTYLKPHEQHRAPHHAAHLFTTYFAFAWLSVLGVQGWFYGDDVRVASVAIDGGFGMKVGQMMCAFQTYEVACAIALPKLRGRHRERRAEKGGGVARRSTRCDFSGPQRSENIKSR